jgi:acetolactate synthase-1/2/3 large subunit
VHNLAIYDALYRLPGIEHVVCRHEQGAGFAADGYSRTSGKPGVYITTTGPGATNAFTALGEAWTDTSPVLHLASQLDVNLIDRNRGVVHELVDQAGTFDKITRLNRSVRDVREVPSAMAQALGAIQSGKPRPAYLDFPQDVLNATADLEVAPITIAAPTEPEEQVVSAVVERLRQARRPVVIAGSGVQRGDAHSELLELAEALQCPVFETAQGRGALPSDHPLSAGGRWYGEPRLHRMLAESDAVVVAGSRLSQTDTSGWSLHLPPVIHLDVDGEWVGLNYPAEHSVVGDLRHSLNLILDGLERSGAEATQQWASQVMAVCRDVDAGMRAEHPVPMGVLDAIDRATPRDAIFTNDSLIQYWTSRHLPVYTPRSYHIPWVYGTLGSALPFAIGSWLAAPQRRVVSISGDGAFMFTCNELATAVQVGANITCVIANDGGYNAMRRFQRLRYGDYTYATDLATPDFAAFACSFGAHGFTLESPAELEAALTEAMRINGPSVIDMPLALDIPWM